MGASRPCLTICRVHDHAALLSLWAVPFVTASVVTFASSPLIVLFDDLNRLDTRPSRLHVLLLSPPPNSPLAEASISDEVAPEPPPANSAPADAAAADDDDDGAADARPTPNLAPADAVPGSSSAPAEEDSPGGGLSRTMLREHRMHLALAEAEASGVPPDEQWFVKRYLDSDEVPEERYDSVIPPDGCGSLLSSLSVPALISGILLQW